MTTITTTNISLNQLTHLHDKLKQVFRQHIVTEKSTEAEMRFFGGQQSVLRYIEKYIEECKPKSST